MQATLQRYREGRNDLCGPSLANERELRHRLRYQPQKITACPYAPKQTHKQELPEDIGGGSVVTAIFHSRSGWELAVLFP